MKKRKIFSGVLGAVLSMSMAFSVPVYAEGIPTDTQTTANMPANIDSTVDVPALLASMYANNTDAEWRSTVKDIFEEEYTFSGAYYRYNFNTMELNENYYFAYAEKDGDYKSIVINLGKGNFTICKGNDYIVNLLEEGKTFWLGNSVDILPYSLVYTVEDGFYSLNFGKPMDYTWGNVPYAPINCGDVLEYTDDTPPTSTEPVETTPNTENIDGYYCGDVDLNGRIDLRDAVLCSQIISGVVQPGDYQLVTADCDANGLIDANDQIQLIRFLVHKADTLPCSDF